MVAVKEKEKRLPFMSKNMHISKTALKSRKFEGAAPDGVFGSVGTGA
jgi:hypothetical protein